MTMDHLSYGIYLNRKSLQPVSVTADSPDLSDSVTELAYSMLKSFTPHMGITIKEGNFLVYISVAIYVTKCRDLHVINVK